MSKIYSLKFDIRRLKEYYNSKNMLALIRNFLPTIVGTFSKTAILPQKLNT